MRAMASKITGVSIICSTVGSGAAQRKHQGFASLASVRGNHRWPVNSPHKRQVTRKMFPFDDVVMIVQRSGIGNPLVSSIGGFIFSRRLRLVYSWDYRLLGVTTPFWLSPEQNGDKITDDNIKSNFVNGNWLVEIFFRWILFLCDWR